MSSIYQHQDGMDFGTPPSSQVSLPPNWTCEQYKVLHARHQAGYQLPLSTNYLGANKFVVAPPVVLPTHYAERFAPTVSQLKPPPSSASHSRISTLEMVATLPIKSREPLLLVVLHLQRRSPSRPWGLGFVHNNDLGQILVSNVDLSLNTLTCRTHVIPLKDHLLGPATVYSPSGVKNCNDAASDRHTAYIQELFESTAPHDIASRSYFHKCHARICPGDILVSLDGGCVLPVSPSSFSSSMSCASLGGHYYHCFDSLNTVTSYLRTVQSVCIVLLRCPHATTAAMTGGNKVKTEMMNPFQAASRATAVWMKILPQKEPTKAVDTQAGVPVGNGVAVPMMSAPPQPSSWPQDTLSTSYRQQGYHNPAFMMQHRPPSQQQEHFRPSQPDHVSISSTTNGRRVAQENPVGCVLSLSNKRLSQMDPLEMLSHLAAMQERNDGHQGPARNAEMSNSSRGGGKNHKKVMGPKLACANNQSKPPVKVERNPWFRFSEGCECIPYDDNSIEYFKEDGTRAALFLAPIGNFNAWLSRRKATWRRRYKVYELSTTEKILTESCAILEKEDNIRETCTVAFDFWNHQGFASFDDWLAARFIQWKRSYSWNARKRKRIQQDCQEVVHLASSNPTVESFGHWLRVRRYQWRMLRRQRQRLIEHKKGAFNDPHSAPKGSLGIVLEKGFRPSTDDVPFRSVVPVGSLPATSPLSPRKRLHLLSSEDKETAFIDEILEAKEEEDRRRTERPPIDIARFFDAAQGIPDDVIAHCFEYVPCREHGKLLRIDRQSSKYLRDRQQLWRSLCPQHWILPRRPRKPWHDLYLSKLKEEHLQRQKQSDDLLCKCSAALFKGDLLQKIEKLVEKAENDDAGFDINYVSGVVCERNSVLNLAVIHRRHKVVRWLVDAKCADIETADRGNFTPLLNAAWAGDRYLVRFFLQRRSNRNVLGTQHSSQGIAPPGFEGLSADKWAEKRGFPDISKLIQMGL